MFFFFFFRIFYRLSNEIKKGGVLMNIMTILGKGLFYIIVGMNIPSLFVLAAFGLL